MASKARPGRGRVEMMGRMCVMEDEDGRVTHHLLWGAIGLAP